MRIGIDARFYGPIGKGLGRYTQKLIENLEKIDFKNQYFIFLRKENFYQYKPKNPNFKKVLADFPWYSLAEQIFMPLKILKIKVDLMHFPHFNVPLLYPKKFIVTIHDLILMHYPTRRASTLDPIRYILKNFFYKFVIRAAVHRAKKVITVSNFTKKDLINFFNLESKKIIVTYEACDKESSFHKSSKEQKSQALPGSFKAKDILNRFRIERPYLLYVGNAYPHKNLEKLLRVFKRLIDEKNFDLQLVLVGRMDYFFKRLKEEAKSLNLFSPNKKIVQSTPVVFTGFVTDEELKELYQKATIYIFPSLYEGFGLPPLEAMCWGVPVVSSKTSCLPEILGNAALYFDPRNEEEMIKIILKALKNAPLRDELKKRGLKRIEKFSWIKCAKKTLKVYESFV